MTIVLADIDTSLRDRLRKRLEKLTDVRVVGESSNSTEITAMILNRNPDVAIMSPMLDGGSGLDVLRQIRQLMIPPTIVIVTDDSSHDQTDAYSLAGADYIVERASDDCPVINAIRLLGMTHSQIETSDSRYATQDD